ncbi:MAG: type I-C CRISPR-associated protein Cas8c/Csd1 [Oscillibacter sp.]|nr:type I-C CRISPR-associated protein Cas8c/Csd1 [Oscillibacter sp.]
MILQALTKLYEDLQAQNKTQEIPVFGYSRVHISAILQIDLNGNLISIMPAVPDDPKKKRPEILPVQMKRSGVNAPPYFLCDNAQYVLGIEKNGATEKAKRCFQSFKAFHTKMLSEVCCQEAEAFLRFLEKWAPEEALENDIVQSSLVYCLNGPITIRISNTSKFLHEIPEILNLWDNYYPSTLSTETGICLVTGEKAQIARIHNSVKGIRADSLSPNGWTLVGFDKDSFNSYGKQQGYNAPVSEYAAFAYTSALNYLLSNKNNVQKIGDTTVVCWAEGAEPQYQTFSWAMLNGAPPQGLRDNDLRAAVKRLTEGLPCEELGLDPKRPFYILGLAPNAARLSVRFFYRDTFGNLMKNINAHHERMEIVRPAYDKFLIIPLWAMLKETVNPNSRDKSASPVMAGAVARAIFTGGPYPAALLESTMLRIRAERVVTRGRAAIIKAYYLRNWKHHPKYSIIEEVMDVRLNKDCGYPPYVLGRLFAVMEEIQLDSADWDLNRSIKDSYFTAAASTPSSAFQKLFPLSDYHLKKLKRDQSKSGRARRLEQEKASLVCLLTEPIPKRFTIDETNCFYIGYYHQVNRKKEEQ